MLKEKDKEIEQLKQEFKKIQDIAKDGNEVILSLNKMKQRYKVALFMIIRNSQVMPKGIELGKSDKEINKMAYETMCEVLTMIDFKRAKEIYEQGKKAYIEKKKRMLKDFSEKGQGQRVFFEEDLELIRDILQELEQKESILDKVTDKLKEDANQKVPLAEDMDWVRCRKEYAREILNIIEGEKK